MASLESEKRTMKKLNRTSPLVIGRHYRWSQYSTRTISVGDPMTRIKNILLCLCGTILTCISSIILQVLALSGNHWGYYVFHEKGEDVESGSFGLWSICITGMMKLEVLDCGLEQPGRRLTLPAWCVISGICGVLCTAFLTICMTIAVLQLIQIVRGEPTWCANRRTLSQKIFPAMFAVFSSSACLIFAALAMRRVRSASVSLGTSYWIQAAVIFFTVILLICTALESFWRPYPSFSRTPEKKVAAGARSAPKQSFFPRETSVRVEEWEVVMHPGAEAQPGHDVASQPSNGERSSTHQERLLLKALYRRSNSEGAAAANRITR